MRTRIRSDFYYKFRSLVLILADAYRTGEALDPHFVEGFYDDIDDIAEDFTNAIRAVANDARTAITIVETSHRQAFKATFGRHSNPEEAERAYRQAVDRFRAEMERNLALEIDGITAYMSSNPYLPQ